MDFKGRYLEMMKEEAPQLLRQLNKQRQTIAFLERQSDIAHDLLDQMLANVPRDQYGEIPMAEEREAEERVFAMMAEFPDPETIAREPPHDLPPDPMPASSASTTSSSRGR